MKSGSLTRRERTPAPARRTRPPWVLAWRPAIVSEVAPRRAAHVGHAPDGALREPTRARPTERSGDRHDLAHSEGRRTGRIPLKPVGTYRAAEADMKRLGAALLAPIAALFWGAIALPACGGSVTATATPEASSDGPSGEGSATGSGSGGGSTSGSGSGGSGFSSSGSGSSSGGLDGVSGGASSGGVTGSSGGWICAPLPGCGSSVDCPAPDGCGVCHCGTAGEWVCRASGCGGDLNDAYPVDDSPYANCPDSPPPPGTSCDVYPAYCQWGVPDLCGNETCECTASGIWACGYNACADEPPFDAGPPCPVEQPSGNSVCPALGMICQYNTGCETNCLCASNGWVCATVQGCVSQDL